jgi:uncharacterized protein YdeI (YjbR/CyaY-like superfamily)
VGKKDKRVDAYIERSADYARPILTHLRSVIHKACPDVEETIKWGFPSFEYRGILCGIGAFKEHCILGFWKAALMKDSTRLRSKDGKDAMGNFGRIQKLSDLPSQKILMEYVREAAELNEKGIKLPPRARSAGKRRLVVPAYFKKALAKNKKASKAFEEFTYSHKKEYLEWITEAKTEETRNRRIETALEWMAQGKSRNWKYMRK